MTMETIIEETYGPDEPAECDSIVELMEKMKQLLDENLELAKKGERL